ncbi:DUF350 domain-containing protein [Blastococcus mobilis]|uniref:DUF350 domain-containing protein n=1 Tax=Blastococcus mobilis TaxID=1938746 RepID=A0A238UPJ7_9ACTN|nr:DUF350 domain-containing protein [Blastococcus mobilis]SNR23199.1 protein of unknown function [Blastococcus mobilis]
MLESIGFAAAYTGVGIALLVVGFYALDLLTPGNLGRHISEHRSLNAAVALAGGFLGQGAIIFASIWTNATSGFGRALLYTVVFGLLGVVLQAVAFVALDVLLPGHLGQHLMEPEFHPASLVSAAVQLAVAVIIVASIWP